MKRRLWFVALVLCLTVAASAADNPYKNAKVGDWVEYTMTTSAMGHDMQMVTKQTVIAKDEAFVTLRTETTAMGQKMPPQEVKIPLNQPYDPSRMMARAETDAKATIIGEGSETITVGGKAYACHWIKMKVTATKPAKTDGTVKAWTTLDVPAGGMVKMEMENQMAMGEKTMTTTMVMELTGFGRK
jgi:hypothetical protein